MALFSCVTYFLSLRASSIAELIALMGPGPVWILIVASLYRLHEPRTEGVAQFWPPLTLKALEDGR